MLVGPGIQRLAEVPLLPLREKVALQSKVG